MAKEDVVFKGNKDGILIRLNDKQPFEVLLQGLIRRLGAAERFFRGATVTLDTGSLDLGNGRRAQLEELISDHFGLKLARMLNNSSDGTDGQEAALTEDVVRALATSVFRGADSGSTKSSQGRDETLLIKRTLRSGQTIRSNGNVVILGDVNPGAEVVARGDVLVLGRLRGMVHAGAMGDDSAVVAAARLEPTQLRISRHITRPPENQPESASVGPPEPEVAAIHRGTVVIDSYLNYDERKQGEVIRHE